VKSSKWNGSLLEFITNNVTNWELDTIPAELTQWISQDKDWERGTEVRQMDGPQDADVYPEGLSGSVCFQLIVCEFLCVVFRSVAEPGENIGMAD
jgi:hypothetical protein